MSVVVRRVGGQDYGTFLKVQIGGDSGAGKTRFASTFPTPLYLATDPSLDSVLDRAPLYVNVEASAQMDEVLVALRGSKAQQEKYLGVAPETIVLDTGDDLQRIFIRERMAENHKDTLELRDYSWLGDQMRDLVRNFRNLPMHVVVTHHLKDDKDEESGKVKVLPGLVGAFAEQISAMFSLSLLIRTEVVARVVDGASRKVEIKVVQTSGDSRHPWVKDRFHVLPTPDYESDLTSDFERIFKAVFGRPMAEGQVVGQTTTPERSTSVDSSSKAAAERKKTSARTSSGAGKPQASLPEGGVGPQDAPEQAGQTEEEAAPEVGPEPSAPEPATEPATEPEPPAEPEAPATEQELNGAEGPTEGDESHVLVESEQASATVEGPAEESVPAAGTGPVGEPAAGPAVEARLSMVCTSGGPQGAKGCGGPIENADQRDLSWLRFRTTLCRSCFQTAKGK